MLQMNKSRAEEKFAAIQKKDKRVRSEREIAQEEKKELTAKLRALRLAKEAADMKATGKDVAKKVSTKSKKSENIR